MRALAKERDRRYQSAADLFLDLEGLRGSVPRLEEREPDPVFGREQELGKLEELLRSAVHGFDPHVRCQSLLNDIAVTK